MADLRPLGSEKLEGISKIKRIMEIARYNEPTTFISEEQNALTYNITLSDGYTYGIVKEKNGYIIKKSINESPMDYIDNMKGRKYYRSQSEALKRLNLTAKEINRSNDYSEETPLIGEQKKFVLKTKRPEGTTPDVAETPPPAPEPSMAPEPAVGAEPAMAPEPSVGAEPAMAPEPAVGAEPEMGMEEPAVGAEPEMGMEEPAVGEEPEMGMDPDEDMGEDMSGPVGLKTIQKLTGRLSQKIRAFDKDSGLDSQDIKYVVNSILSAIDLEKLDDEDRDDILDKLEDYESYGEEGEGELDLSGEDMGAEPEMGMEEPPMGAEPAGIEVPPMAESKVERILKSYFKITENEKPLLEEKRKKDFLKSKITQIKVKNEIKQLSESKIQMEVSMELISENAKFLGKTNKENLVFLKNGKQLRVTPRGRVL